jgi:uncharacterized protein
MLLLIVLSNTGFHLWAARHGASGWHPVDGSALDRVVQFVMITMLDLRVYPLFAFLFGYGITQLARRRPAGAPVVATVRRRGWWMVAIGAAHGVLLWPGDIVGSYGLIAVVLAGVLVAGTTVSLLTTAAVGFVLTALFGALQALPLPGTVTAALPSMAATDPAVALVIHTVEWLLLGPFAAVTAVGAVALGAWAARSRILEEPERHRGLLVRVAVLGLGSAVVGGLPLALAVAGVWQPPLGLLLAAGLLHAACGYAGGLGYAALFGLVATRPRARPVTGALVACGQRSLSCYLAQSVAFVALLPAWTLGLGARITLWQATLLGVGVWLVTVLVAAGSARAGIRGPAEVLLRRPTYGRRPASEDVRSAVPDR